jgi:DNA-binding Lrp family transcriptional regulator
VDTPVADGARVPSTPDASLDAVERKILDLIQSGFPLESRPYAVIGGHAGIGEEEALERVRSLRRRGVVRRIGANFQSGKIGFKSTLCAAKVPSERLEAFIAAVNAEEGVTHNYLRDHAYNVWFTYIGPSMEQIEAALERIRAATGIRIVNLPAERLYKIKVDFRMDAT